MESFLSIEKLNLMEKQISFLNKTFCNDNSLYLQHGFFESMDNPIHERIMVLSKNNSGDLAKIGECYKNENNILKNNFYHVENNPIEIEMILSSYRLFANAGSKKKYHDIYKKITDITLAIQKPLFNNVRQDGLKMDFYLNEKLEIKIHTEANINNFPRIITAPCNEDRLFNELYWKRIFFKLYKLELFFIFEDFKDMNNEEIETHLKLLSY